MGTVASLLAKVEALKVEEVASKSIDETKKDLLRLNNDQLLAGKLRDGSDLYPTYLEDPYFKSVAAAQRYSDWKDRITPNPKRKKGVPNLYINGFYHNSREINVRGEVIEYSGGLLGPKIEAKYGPLIDGVGGEFKVEYNKILKPVFIKGVREKINL